jgi:hypothetical protein
MTDRPDPPTPLTGLHAIAWRQQQRATLLGLLLKQMIDSVEVLREFYAETCPFCAAGFGEPHTAHCLIFRIERALAPGADIAALLAAWEGDGE